MNRRRWNLATSSTSRLIGSTGLSGRFGWPCIISDPKGGTLFVNLGASQAVLGSRGLGTDFARCKLADRNQAVIAHTNISPN